MVSFNKYETLVTDIAAGNHSDALATADTDTLKVMLSNTTPNASTHSVRADSSEIAGGNGYTSGGNDTQNDATDSAGTITVVCTDTTFTATGTGIATFRYVIIYNDTPTSPADPLMGWWDYGSTVDLAASETFKVDFGANFLTIS